MQPASLSVLFVVLLLCPAAAPLFPHPAGPEGPPILQTPGGGHGEVAPFLPAFPPGPHEEWLDGRRFLWQTPTTPPPPEGYPLLFVLHGAAQPAEAWFGRGLVWGWRQTAFAAQALQAGYALVAPDSLRPVAWGPKAWDVFSADVNSSLDLPFFAALIAWLDDAPFSVNQRALYCAGFSSGAFMTSRLARTFPRQFSAVAVHSGTDADAITLTWRGPEFDCISPQNFSPQHPPTLVVQGGKDRFVPAACGLHYYEQLQRNNISSALLYNPEGGHIWQGQFNQDILAWFAARGT